MSYNILRTIPLTYNFRTFPECLRIFLHAIKMTKYVSRGFHLSRMRVMSFTVVTQYGNIRNTPKCCHSVAKTLLATLRVEEWGVVISISFIYQYNIFYMRTLLSVDLHHSKLHEIVQVLCTRHTCTIKYKL